jgi:hypothetical protein
MLHYVVTSRMMLSPGQAARSWPRVAGGGAVGALGTFLVIGVPTDVVANPWFGRQTPVRAFDVVVLVALSLLTGALVASYLVPAETAAGPGRAGFGSGVLGWFAVSCPACNKVVVALLGASGATGVFGPLQPALGALAVALAAGALAVRVRSIRRGRCAVPR